MFSSGIKYEGQVVKDRFGGYNKLKFKATGFFRLEYSNRWWIVTPEGNAFLSFGVNHLDLFALKASYNMDFWGSRFSIPLEKRANESEYLKGFCQKVEDDFNHIGFNTFGCHSPTDYYQKPSPHPYVKSVHFTNLCHYMSPDAEEFKDVFSSDYLVHCDEFAKKTCAPLAEDEMLLAYSLEDCPLYTDLECAPRLNTIHGQERGGTPTYPNVLRNLGENAEGKKAYVECMKTRYASIEDFNRVYYTEFASFDELLAKANWRRGIDWTDEAEQADNMAFLLQILDKKYAVQKAAIKKYDSNHLIFGDKLDGNIDTPLEFVKLADKHFDLVFYQYYAFADDQIELFKSWQSVTDKPFFMGDSSINAPTKQSKNPYGPHCESQEARADEFKRAFEYLFSQPNYVGWDWCGWVDQWSIAQPGKQHVGFQDAFGNYYKPLTDAMITFSSRMYDIALSEVE